uniref:Uncharacterized protein n=2 Tax=Cyprinus carpio TaxID=7962 RepID=A0A9R1SQK1_CYPCA
MRNKRPKNADELKATVKETWASIPPQQWHKLITSMPRSERKEFIFDFIKTFIEADIPLEKTYTFSAFLQKYCKQGAAVMAPSHLRSDYLQQLFPQYLEDIKQVVH